MYLTRFEFITENMLAHKALDKPVAIPRAKLLSNLKIKTIPSMIFIPAITSNLDMRLLLVKGSRIDVNSVMDDRQTSVTDTVDILIEWKNRIQCRPKIAPVKKSLRKALIVTLKLVFVATSQAKSDTDAIRTRYHTNCVAGIVMSAPNMPVKPQINTVKCKIRTLLFRCSA